MQLCLGKTGEVSSTTTTASFSPSSHSTLFCYLRNHRCSGGARPLGLPVSAWPPLQQPHQHQNGSDMRVVFHGGSGTRRESSGTGVFLPRRTGAPSETRKKPACSIVLLPARVVQALNLNFEAMDRGGAQPRFSNGRSVQGNVLLSQQTLNFRHNQASMTTEVIQPPQEWTY